MDAQVLRPSSNSDCEELLGEGVLIPRGLGRSYGDSSLGPFALESSRLDHLISFDQETGLLRCQAGISIYNILNLIVPRGWFMPVRSLLMLGEHSANGCLELGGQSKKSLPIDMPTWVLNPYSIKAFNFLYFHKSIFSVEKTDLPYRPYFYPLDAINNWNRLYGKNGFIQYQFVVPKAVGVKGLKRILDVISKSNKGSFLAVLKVFGKGNENYLSFPFEGYSLALDFKMESGIVELVKRLDSMVLEMGGRVYLTKDALMSEQMFKSTYPQWQIFEEVRAKYGAIGRFASNQSRRLGLQ